MRSLLHFEVPVVDMRIPMTHTILGATAILVEHLEDAGLLATSAPKWSLNQETGCLVADVKTVPTVPDDPIPVTPLAKVTCPECGCRFDVV